MANFITRTIETVTVQAKIYYKELDEIKIEEFTVLAPVTEPRMKKVCSAIYPDGVYLGHAVVSTDSKRYQMPIDKFLKYADEIKESEEE